MITKIKHNDNFYCINLDSRPDRWNHSLKQFEKLGIAKIIKRISGVDFGDKSVESGRAGCTAAFFKVFQKTLINKDRIFTIFEDDVLFYSDSAELINAAMDTILINGIEWDIVFWGCRPIPEVRCPLQKTQFDSLIKVNCAQAAHAITFNAESANKCFAKIPIDFLDKEEMIKFINSHGVSDVFLKKELVLKGRAFCPNGLAANQINDFSNIDQKPSSRQKDIFVDFYKYLKMANDNNDNIFRDT